jgi:hypothetical protein
VDGEEEKTHGVSEKDILDIGEYDRDGFLIQ